MRLKIKKDAEENILDKLLACYTRCRCKCVGFKPARIDYSIIYDMDHSWLNQVDRDDECDRCTHTLETHFEAILNMSDDERTKKLKLIEDIERVHSRLNGNESHDVLRVLVILFQDMLKSVRDGTHIQTNHPFGQPEKLNLWKIVSLFLSKSSSNKKKQLPVAKNFLKTIDNFRFPTPTEYHEFFFGRNMLLTLGKYIDAKLMKRFEETDSKIEEIRQVATFMKDIQNFAKKLTEDHATKNVQQLAYEDAQNVLDDEFAFNLENYQNQIFEPEDDSMDVDDETSRSMFSVTSPTTSNGAYGAQWNQFDDIPDYIMKRAVARLEIERAKSKLEGHKTTTDPFEIAARRGHMAKSEEEEQIIDFYVISNVLDIEQSKQKLAWLVQTQTLFGTQLPKMPKEYITRLVFDPRHVNLIMVKKDKGVVAGICVREFSAQGFVEIVFCAVIGTEQVKGYGTHMMNKLKDYYVSQKKIYHFLTYADEFAVGYFKKQGFSMGTNLAKEKYIGYIKEYEGASFMGCQLHPKIVYTEYSYLLKEMRDLYQCVVEEIKEKEKIQQSNLINNVEELFNENGGKSLSLSKIPGLKDSSLVDDLMPAAPNLKNTLRIILNKLKNEKAAWPFNNPVRVTEVPDYYKFIRYPIDFKTMTDKLNNDYYIHERLFIADLNRLVMNCYKFNSKETVYYACGYKMHSMFLKLCKQYLPKADLFMELPEARPDFPKKFR